MANQNLSLSQEQRQLQILAPQLRQSLEFLQAPVLELRSLVQQELQRNPTLEEKPLKTEPLEIEPDGAKSENAKELNFKETFEVLARIDQESYNYFFQDLSVAPHSADRAQKRDYFLNSQVKPESLQEHLAAQLNIAGLEEQDRRIGELIIGSINDDGYLLQSIDDLAASTGFDAGRIQDVLTVIQDFDPIGVGARDLAECLLLQLERMGQGNSLAALIVGKHLDELPRKQFAKIAQALAVPAEAVQQAAHLIGTLDPKPGRMFSMETATYIFPDVIVERGENGYQVVMNDEHVPRVWINRKYKQMLDQADTPAETKEYIRERIRSGLFLIKSIAQRQRTLYAVASEITRIQTDFFDSGIAHLKPLTMSEVAKAIGMHETTVCRCLANKYMQTPRGIYEMKYFFTPGLKADNGHAVSNKVIQDRIVAMFDQEDPNHPLSDQDVVEKFKTDGLHVARRTVAKYRLLLKIPPSHLRKLQ